jgi:hypothetical protein
MFVVSLLQVRPYIVTYSEKDMLGAKSSLMEMALGLLLRSTKKKVMLHSSIIEVMIMFFSIYFISRVMLCINAYCIYYIEK